MVRTADDRSVKKALVEKEDGRRKTGRRKSSVQTVLRMIYKRLVPRNEGRKQMLVRTIILKKALIKL
jgi:hypothetical protein